MNDVGEQLKACPFCGGQAIVSSHPAPFKDDGSVFRIECVEQSCKAQPATFHMDTKAEAVSAWNTRPIEDRIAKELKDELNDKLYRQTQWDE